MSQRRIPIALLASAATAASLALAGSASADVITNASTGTPLAPGSTLNVLGTVASTFHGGTAIWSCSRTLGTGTIGANPVAGTGDVTGSIRTLTFDGGTTTTRCSSTIVGMPYATLTVDASAGSPLQCAADAQTSTFAVSKAAPNGVRATLSYYTAAAGGAPIAVCAFNASSLTAALNSSTSTMQFLNAPLTYDSSASSGPAKALCVSNPLKFSSTLRLTAGGANVSLQ